MKTVVGISQKIKRAWVDAALDRLIETTDEADLRNFIDSYLENELPGKASRAKRVGIISSVWTNIPRERIVLRDRAVALLPNISGQERTWLHWGMTALAYPLFRDTAEVVGRLLALQDDFTTAQVQARIATSWGDRVTSKRAAKYLLNTLVDWEVLRSTKTKGHFLLARKMTARMPDLQLWLLEALLGASAADEIEARQLLRLPESFPFTLSIGIAELRKNDVFNIHRQGLDMDMVALRKVKREPPQKPTKKPKWETPAKSDAPSLFDGHTENVVSSNGSPDAIPAAPVTTHGADDDHGDVDADQYALYAEFGIAAEKAQVLEVELGNVALAFLSLFVGKDQTIDADQRAFFRSVVDDINRKTLGYLLKSVKSMVTFDDSILQIVDEALERRNYLSHNFFRNRSRPFG